MYLINQFVIHTNQGDHRTFELYKELSSHYGRQILTGTFFSAVLNYDSDEVKGLASSLSIEMTFSIRSL